MPVRMSTPLPPTPPPPPLPRISAPPRRPSPTREQQRPAGTSYLTPRARRELLVLGAALLCGVLVMPLLVWVVGNRVLGPYTHGQNTHAGPLALLADFLLGLLHGSAVFWAMALGPLVLLLLLRALLAALRAVPAESRED
jgi:hypothetical protein